MSARFGVQDELWAITSYWNPMGYRSKVANFRIFREHLNVPLVVVELACGPGFELNREDAEVLLQRRGDGFLWQKERLLNLALEALPGNCRKVVWIDCDVVFERDDWAQATNLLLDRFMLLQPFSHVHRMPPDWKPGQTRPPAELLRSVPFLIASGMPEAVCLGTPASRIHCSPGYAWAAHRHLLEKHLLYDVCIVGGADTAMARAAYGHFEDAMRLQYLHRNHYLAWAGPFFDSVCAKVAFVDGTLWHLWHGDTRFRRYRDRNEEMRRFEFDPFTDIAIDQNGVWRWNSDKHDLHDYVRSYFSSRREDD
jgi:hypothetical protein